ncbi:COP9 signalosome subunit CsnE [Trichodelitschia bisporula]|uniref:COP9 signalosome complex subunit 5 n=1 Tax=Trichodelitschia bisporula TaxID=703511 RepID=A0A6G1HNW0_9PEZI|nr:COP9 signalosome subunit CsnE [Trichodelitschia bisporula]
MESLTTWELENAIGLVDPIRDALYTYSASQQRAINDQKPWRTNPHYFQNVRISAVALLKMVTHARAGGAIEVMGLMQGHVQGDTFVVTDAFRLPVEGTETRVNAQDDANEYMVKYLELARENNQPENVVGWYHSHPGYGCWLSGIDVSTQALQQQFQDPFVAVVIDPDRTISAGKVEIGAFRTFPEDYKPAGEAGTSDADGFQTIPVDKMQDFGAHSERYYSLDVSHFKSSLDSALLVALWNKYWIGTLSANPLAANRDFSNRQMKELARLISDAETAHGSGSKVPGRTLDAKLEKIAKTSRMVAVEERAGMVATLVKERVFRAPEI